jgi:DNA-binding NarL/FixJ family response regulator
MKPIRILLADDHPVVLDGLIRILDRPEFEIVGTVPDGRSLIQAAVQLEPDLILVDISMPELGGIDALRALRKLHLNTKVIVLTMHSEVAYAVEAITAGASGYKLKSSVGEELVTSIHEVMQGRMYIADSIRGAVLKALVSSPKRTRDGADLLTSRQREVLRLLAQGLQVKVIAAELNVSPKTIEFHKQQMKQILGVQTVAELAIYAARHEIMD